nr:hypothetical protein [Tanacetum cinerariifolium]
MGQDRQMQKVGGNGGNQFRQYAGKNAGNMNGYKAVQNVKNQGSMTFRSRLHCQAKEKGCCLSSNTVVDCSKGRGRNPTSSRRQASSSGTQTNNTPVYDSDGSVEYTELLEPIPEPPQVP